MLRKKILIVDLDNCTVAAQRSIANFKAPDHLLSEQLLSHVKAEKYDGFYVCTHRCHANDGGNIRQHLEPVEMVRDYMLLAKKKKIDTSAVIDVTHIDNECQFVTRIIKNFQQAAGFTDQQCFAVSTPDDAGHECGSGFTHILKPYEEAVIRTKRTTAHRWPNGVWGTKTYYDFSLEMDFKQTPIVYYDDTTKNPQLMQIFQHVSQLFPEAEIDLDYVDDSKPVLANALKIKQDDIPHHVKLHVFEHDAFLGFEKTTHAESVIKQGTVQKEHKESKQPESLRSQLKEPKSPVDSLDNDELVLNQIFSQVKEKISKEVKVSTVFANESEFKASIKKYIEKSGDNREYPVDSDKLSELVLANTSAKQHWEHPDPHALFYKKQILLELNEHRLHHQLDMARVKSLSHK